MRIKVTGRGLKDFVLNYPYIFEVVEPEDVESPQGVAGGHESEFDATLQPPPDGASGLHHR